MSSSRPATDSSATDASATDPSATELRVGLGVLLGLAWPVMLARMSQSVVGFCDSLMIAPLGETAIVAVTTGAMNTFLVIILPMGVAFIVQSFASQLTGKGDLVGARRYAWYGLILAALVTVIGFLTIPLVGPVLSVLPFAPGVHDHMTDYMSIRLLSVGAIVATEALGNWYGGLGNTRIHMIASMLTMVLNVVLNWLLIEGNLGLPGLGVEGAALSSLIASWAGFALIAVVFAKNWGYQRVAGPLGLRMAEFVRMLRFGIPNGINWFMEFAAFILFINVVVARLGTVAHAALMVVIQINSVAFMPAFGLASSGAILVGQAIGKVDYDEASRVVRMTAIVAAIWQGSIGLFYVILPGELIGLFEPESAQAAEFLAVGTTLLIISAAWQLFDSLGLTLGETLRAAGDTTWCMWARLTVAWVVFTPLSLVWVLVLDGGPVASMLCLIIYLALLAGLLLWRYRTGKWRDIDLTGSEALPDLTDAEPAP